MEANPEHRPTGRARHRREIFLYLATGVLGAGVDFLFFAAGLSFGLNLIFSQWVGAGAGAIHNSVIHHYVVFEHDRKLRHTAIPNVLLSIVVIFLSGPLLAVVGFFLQDVWLGKLVVLGVVAVASYLIRKLLIFGKRNKTRRCGGSDKNPVSSGI